MGRKDDSTQLTSDNFLDSNQDRGVVAESYVCAPQLRFRAMDL